MALTVKQIEAIKPGDKELFLNDGNGLYLFVATNGSKRWRVRYYFQGARKMLSLGLFPIVGLKEARDKALDIKRLLVAGIDPSEERKIQKKGDDEQSDNFEWFARQWMETKNWAPHTAKLNRQRLEKNVFPFLGKRDIRTIDEQDLREVLKHIEVRGSLETQIRVCALCSSIFRFARRNIKGLENPTEFIKDDLPSPIKKNFPTITHPAKVGKLLHDLQVYGDRATVEVGCALRLAPYVLLRPKNICEGEWSEIDFETCEWTISADKMKMKRPHIVPLSSQAMEILKYLQKFTGARQYMFPSHRKNALHITTDALRLGIHRAGYAVGEFTTHGFRHMGTTLLNELGYRREWIELQMAHVERNSIVKAYNHAQYMPGRRQMMQEWADYLDTLKENSANPNKP